MGRSGVKIVGSDGRRLEVFPALVCAARPIEEPHEARRAQAQTLEFEGQQWFWGEAAQIHGHAQPANDAGFELDNAYAVLLCAATQQARHAGLKQALRSGELVHRLQPYELDVEVDQAKARVHEVIREAIARIQALQPDVQHLILAGGGVELLNRAQLPRHEVAAGGRYAVADGLARIATGL